MRGPISAFNTGNIAHLVPHPNPPGNPGHSKPIGYTIQANTEQIRRCVWISAGVIFEVFVHAMGTYVKPSSLGGV